MENPGGCIAEHRTLEAVSKSRALKHNGEQALTLAAQCQIRPATTVYRLYNLLRLGVDTRIQCTVNPSRGFLSTLEVLLGKGGLSFSPQADRFSGLMSSD